MAAITEAISVNKAGATNDWMQWHVTISWSFNSIIMIIRASRHIRKPCVCSLHFSPFNQKRIHCLQEFEFTVNASAFCLDTKTVASFLPQASDQHVALQRGGGGGVSPLSLPATALTARRVSMRLDGQVWHARRRPCHRCSRRGLRWRGNVPVFRFARVSCKSI